MSVRTLVTVDEYRKTSYSPDCEYRDGILVERNIGTKSHSLLQGKLTHYLSNRRKQWKIQPYTALRIQVRENWYPIPDVCIYSLPDFEEPYPSIPPLLWIEILSPDDRMVDVWAKADELIRCGVPNVWIINPDTLASELRNAAGIAQISDKTLSLPETQIVIPLLSVMEE
jgi:Uma2 family endonuclease